MRWLFDLPASVLGVIQGYFALVLLGLSLVALPRAYVRAYQFHKPFSSPESRLVLASMGLAAILRWLIAPLWIVTMFVGYRLTQQALDLLPVSHYGVGSSALYHALFAFLPRDHRSMLWVNSILGVLTIPFYATYAARMTNDRRAGALFALFVALVPLFVKNDNSDANNVPCLLWLFGGLVLWDEALETGKRAALAGAISLFALATIARPEMPVLLPILVGLTTWGAWGDSASRAPFSRPVWFVSALLYGIAILPQVLHVARSSIELEVAPGSSAHATQRFLMIPLDLFANDTVLRPRLYPLGLFVLAVCALLAKPPEGRRRRVALALMALVSLGIYAIDLCEANMARVHVPGALFVTMLAALGLSGLLKRFPSWPYRAAGIVLLVLTAVPTVFRLWAPTNEQAEEVLIREALEELPASEPFTLVRIGWDDRDKSKTTEFTHYHFPDYLVEKPSRKGKVSSIAAWEQRPRFDSPAYFYFGVRCYASMRPEGTPPPPGDNLQAPCKRMRETFDLEPVFEREIPNRGDLWLEYYGDAPRLGVGLYAIRPKSEEKKVP